MLTNQKNAELVDVPEEYKGRLVLCGDEKLDCFGINRIDDIRREIQDKGLSVSSLQGSEFPIMYTVEAATAAEQGTEVVIFMADEHSAYSGVSR